MKFIQGDPIRVTHIPCAYFDRAGIIAEVVEGQHHPYRVDGLADWPLWFGPHELVLAEHRTSNESETAA